MAAQFDLKRDTAGWTVFDRWTGEAVVIALIPQVGMSFANAEALVRALNQRGDGDRRVLQ